MKEQTNVYNKYYLKSCYNKIIQDVKEIRNLTEKYNSLDNQDYLNFLDTLNELSIDQDR